MLCTCMCMRTYMSMCICIKNAYCLLGALCHDGRWSRRPRYNRCVRYQADGDGVVAAAMSHPLLQAWKCVGQERPAAGNEVKHPKVRLAIAEAWAQLKESSPWLARACEPGYDGKAAPPVGTCVHVLTAEELYELGLHELAFGAQTYVRVGNSYFEAFGVQRPTRPPLSTQPLRSGKAPPRPPSHMTSRGSVTNLTPSPRRPPNTARAAPSMAAPTSTRATHRRQSSSGIPGSASRAAANRSNVRLARQREAEGSTPVTTASDGVDRTAANAKDWWR